MGLIMTITGMGITLFVGAMTANNSTLRAIGAWLGIFLIALGLAYIVDRWRSCGEMVNVYYYIFSHWDNSARVSYLNQIDTYCSPFFD